MVGMNSFFRPGLLSVTFRDHSPEAVIGLVSEAGLQSIEWGGDVHVRPGNTKEAERIGKRTREAGLEISAYGSYYKFEDIDPQAIESGPSIHQVLDTAEALGARMIRIWPGSVGSAEASEDWREAVVERTQEFAERAESRKLELGFEFHNHSLTDTTQSTQQLLDAIDRRNVSTFWQTNRGVTEAAMLDSLRKLLDQVTNIHCHHLVEELTPPFELLEVGEPLWKRIFELLEASERPHYVSLEFVKDGLEENFRRDAAALKRWCEGKWEV